MSRKGKILCIEDEQSIQNIVRTYLSTAGYDVQCVADGLEGLNVARTTQPDLIVLDINLPGMRGFEIAAHLRQESDVYIIMLTARGEEEDRLTGLGIGADDYITKPFSPRELVARVEAVMRRQRGGDRKGVDSAEITYKHLTINEETHEVHTPNGLLELTITEFNLLLELVNHAGRVLSRTQLLDRVWGADFYGNDRVVDVYVSQVRRKLEQAIGLPLIETVRGVGYKFIDEKKRVEGRG